MARPWRLTATLLGLTSVIAACAQGQTAGLGGSTPEGGSTTTTSHPASSSSSSNGTGGTGGTGGATSSSSSSGTGGMTLCGNGVKDPGEQCDGSDFGSATCQSEGLGSGNLQCNSACNIIVSGCEPVEDCTNMTDDNDDGLVDCDDPTCAGKPACADSCPTTYTASIGDFFDGDTTGRPNVHKASCSSATSGPEVIIQVTATATGIMSLDLTSFGTNLSLSVRSACATDASETACTSTPNPQFFGDYTLGVPVTMGQTYFVMVEAMTPADAGGFSLSIDIPGPEDVCYDFQDNDFDGYTDCDDPDTCQGSMDCQPGATPTGQPCTQNTDCTANHNDPVCLDEFDFGQFPSGYCSEFCDVAAQDCAPGNICYAGLKISKNGVCLHTCTSDADCRTADGYACVSAGLSKKVCMIAPETKCADWVDNDSNNLLDCQDPSCQSSAACVPGTTAVGQPCTQHDQCTSSPGVNNPFCFDEANEDYANGYCSHFCDPMVASSCQAGTTCVNRGPGGAYVCMVNCTQDSDCREAETYFCTADNVCDYF